MFSSIRSTSMNSRFAARAVRNFVKVRLEDDMQAISIPFRDSLIGRSPSVIVNPCEAVWTG
jgi:hypothetical protein